jgi:predicted dehydrogenase
MDRRAFLSRAAGVAAGMALVPESLSHTARWAGAPMRVGVIGCGRQGRRIVLEMVDSMGDAASIAAVCDVVERSAQNLAGRARGAAVFLSHREMLDKVRDLQAVFIATPTNTHREIALDCLAAEKHIYCEAPLAHTIEDCVTIARTAREKKAVFAVGCEGRANPVYQLARTFLRSDAVRDLVSVYAQDHRKVAWGRPGDWWLDPEKSGGLATEMGVQQLDVVHWFRGTYPAEVSGRGAIRLHDDGRTMPDSIRATLIFRDGVEMHYQATLANSFGGRHEVFFGTNAAIKLAWTHGWMFKEADSPQLGFEVYANRQQFHNDEGITLIADATKLAAQGRLKEGVGLPHAPLHYSLLSFLDAAANGGTAHCTASEGARATIVAISMSEAIRTGRTVPLDDSLLKGI